MFMALWVKNLTRTARNTCLCSTAPGSSVQWLAGVLHIAFLEAPLPHSVVFSVLDPRMPKANTPREPGGSFMIFSDPASCVAIVPSATFCWLQMNHCVQPKFKKRRPKSNPWMEGVSRIFTPSSKTSHRANMDQEEKGIRSSEVTQHLGAEQRRSN
jgi:hypothetical protein